MKYPDKTNKKIGDYIYIIEILLELTENEPQFLEFREGHMRDLEDKTYMNAVARSIYYDRYLTVCENFINWKYITKDAKKRSIEYMKYLLSFNVGTRNKFYNELEEYNNNDNDNNDIQKDKEFEEYDDDMINSGIEDL